MDEKEKVETLDADEAIDEAFEEAESEDEEEDEELDDSEEDEDEDDDSEEDDEASEEEDPFEGLFDDDEDDDSEDEDDDPEDDEDDDPEDDEDDDPEDDEDDDPEDKDGTPISDVTNNAKYDALSNEVKATLKKLGYNGEGDPMEMLKRLQAEADGVSAAEYDRKQAFEKQAALDIEAIHKAFPETAKFKHLRELPNVGKFARLMDDKDMKLSVVEAFAASHPEIVFAHVAGANRAKNLAGTKNHLSSSVPKGAKDVSVNISRRELDEYRDMFPELSDKQIKELYKSANK